LHAGLRRLPLSSGLRSCMTAAGIGQRRGLRHCSGPAASRSVHTSPAIATGPVRGLSGLARDVMWPTADVEKIALQRSQVFLALVEWPNFGRDIKLAGVRSSKPVAEVQQISAEILSRQCSHIPRKRARNQNAWILHESDRSLLLGRSRKAATISATAHNLHQYRS
jgi:hypothetical protein